jgi:hypothetical protein
MTSKDCTECKEHGPLMQTLAELCADLKWMVRISKWGLGVIGGALGIMLVTLLPVVVGVVQEQNAMKRQITINTLRLEMVCEQIKLPVKVPKEIKE